MSERFEFDKRGWLSGIEHMPSPNFNQRPVYTEINLLVIHNISLPPGEYGGPYINDLFLNQLDPLQHPFFQSISSLQVSAHFLIRREGDLVQFVSVCDRAWHAGQSKWQGISDCNDYSIGVELEGCDTEPFNDAQYQTLIKLSQRLVRHFPAITLDRIVGHSDIAPGRKTDPGPCFDWADYRQVLSERLLTESR